MHVQNCCFANKTNCFYDIVVVVVVVLALAPYLFVPNKTYRARNGRSKP